MWPTLGSMCVHVCPRACTHTHTNILAMGVKAQDCTSELLCVGGCGLCICGSPGRPVPVCMRAPSFFPSCFSGSQEAVCSAGPGVALWNILLQTVYLDCLPTPVEGPQAPRKELGSRAESGQWSQDEQAVTSLCLPKGQDLGDK